MRDDSSLDPVGELGGVGPTLPRGRDKSGPYALAIASLGLSWQFANRIYLRTRPWLHSIWNVLYYSQDRPITQTR
jgi:hypothetical protein